LFDQFSKKEEKKAHREKDRECVYQGRGEREIVVE